MEIRDLVGKHSWVEFKGHKRLYTKVVDTIAKTLSMKPTWQWIKLILILQELETF